MTSAIILNSIKKIENGALEINWKYTFGQQPHKSTKVVTFIAEQQKQIGNF